MMKIPRMLATRLRRLTSHRPRPLGTRTATAESWARLERALTGAPLPGDAERRRELVEERLRVALTLLGQQRRSAHARVLAAMDGETKAAAEAATIVLMLAARFGQAE